MPIFTRILDFKRELLARLRNKRSHPRYRVGVGFPLKASLSLVGSERFNPNRAPGNAGMNWSGGLGNISSGGLSVLLSPAAATARGESSRVRLTLENHELSFTCHVAHFRVHSSHAICGLQLEFDDFKAQKSYLQIVEAVSLGASFVAAGPGRSRPGLTSKSWRSSNRTLLTEWRNSANHALDSFEMSLGEHLLQGRTSQPGLVVVPRKDTGKPVPPTVQEEVRQLFRWVVGNLPKGVPSDLREFMGKVGGLPAGVTAASWQPPAPITAQVSAEPVATAPAGAWRGSKPPMESGFGA